jgi:hypothetical protein
MATAVPGCFTPAAPTESPGRTKPGAQWDSRRYQSPATVTGAIADYRLLITVIGVPGVSTRQIFQLARAC